MRRKALVGFTVTSKPETAGVAALSPGAIRPGNAGIFSSCDAEFSGDCQLNPVGNRRQFLVAWFHWMQKKRPPFATAGEGKALNDVGLRSAF